MKKKSILTLLCLLLVVALSVMGTLAYLTDRDAVANTFTVGRVNITLDEADVDEDGVPILDENGDPVARVGENEYHLIPGRTYTKDPTITVEAGSEDAYIRMLVTINCYSELTAIFGDEFLPETYVSDWDSVVWPCVAMVDNGDNTVTYEFRYHATVGAVDTDALGLEPLFTGFTLPGEITGEQLETIQGLEITVKGHAIQAATFETDEEAWAAFEEQYPAGTGDTTSQG